MKTKRRYSRGIFFILTAVTALCAASCKPNGVSVIQSNPLGAYYPEPRQAAIKPREVFVINGLAETLTVINPDSLETYADVQLTGMWPNHLLCRNGKLYLTNSGNNNIIVFDKETLKPLAEIYLGHGRNPWMIIDVPGSEKGYVPNFVAGTVSVVNLETYKVIKEIKVGTGPEGGCYLNGRVYVGNTAWNYDLFGFLEGTVSVIDTASDEVIKTISTEDEKYSPALEYWKGDPDHRPRPEGSNPQSAVAFPDKNEVHIILTGKNGGKHADDGEILVIDGDTWKQKARLAIGGSPGWSCAGLDEENGIVYLTGVGGLQSYNYKTLELLHDSKHYIIAGSNPEFDFFSGVTYDKVTKRLFVAHFTQDKIVVMKADAVTDSYTIEQDITGSDGAQIPYLFTE